MHVPLGNDEAEYISGHGQAVSGFQGTHRKTEVETEVVAPRGYGLEIIV
jgi:hypothetical protein